MASIGNANRSYTQIRNDAITQMQQHGDKKSIRFTDEKQLYLHDSNKKHSLNLKARAKKKRAGASVIKESINREFAFLKDSDGKSIRVGDLVFQHVGLKSVKLMDIGRIDRALADVLRNEISTDSVSKHDLNAIANHFEAASVRGSTKIAAKKKPGIAINWQFKINDGHNLRVAIQQDLMAAGRTYSMEGIDKLLAAAGLYIDSGVNLKTVNNAIGMVRRVVGNNVRLPKLMGVRDERLLQDKARNLKSQLTTVADDVQTIADRLKYSESPESKQAGELATEIKQLVSKMISTPREELASKLKEAVHNTRLLISDIQKLTGGRHEAKLLTPLQELEGAASELVTSLLPQGSRNNLALRPILTPEVVMDKPAELHSYRPMFAGTRIEATKVFEKTTVSGSNSVLSTYRRAAENFTKMERRVREALQKFQRTGTDADLTKLAGAIRNAETASDSFSKFLRTAAHTGGPNSKVATALNNVQLDRKEFQKLGVMLDKVNDTRNFSSLQGDSKIQNAHRTDRTARRFGNLRMPAPQNHQQTMDMPLEANRRLNAQMPTRPSVDFSGNRTPVPGPSSNVEVMQTPPSVDFSGNRTPLPGSPGNVEVMQMRPSVDFSPNAPDVGGLQPQAQPVDNVPAPVGLRNSGVDCYLNSALQQLGAIGDGVLESLEQNRPNDPFTREFRKFVKGQSFNDRTLRQALYNAAHQADESLAPVIDGTARSQDDAGIVVEGLLKFAGFAAPFQTHMNGGAVNDPMTQLMVGGNSGSLANGFNENASGANGLTVKMTHLPPATVFRVERYEQKTGMISNKRVEIGSSIELTDQHGRKATYEPSSISIRRGTSANSGHYINYRKSGDMWFEVDDSNVWEVPWDFVAEQAATQAVSVSLRKLDASDQSTQHSSTDQVNQHSNNDLAPPPPNVQRDGDFEFEDIGLNKDLGIPEFDVSPNATTESSDFRNRSGSQIDEAALFDDDQSQSGDVGQSGLDNNVPVQLSQSRQNLLELAKSLPDELANESEVKQLLEAITQGRAFKREALDVLDAAIQLDSDTAFATEALKVANESTEQASNESTIQSSPPEPHQNTVDKNAAGFLAAGKRQELLDLLDKTGGYKDAGQIANLRGALIANKSKEEFQELMTDLRRLDPVVLSISEGDKIAFQEFTSGIESSPLRQLPSLQEE